MRYVSTIAVAAALASATSVEAAVKHATGTFEVKMTPVTQDAVDGVAMSRLSMTKRFDGSLAATSQGEMLTASGAVAGSAAYVLIERVSGTLDGKTGSFALMHSATMAGSKFDQRIVVVPDSATGALAGLSGSMTIRIEGGKHFYDLAYETTAP